MSRSTRTPSEDEIQGLILGPVIHAPNQDVAPVVLGDYLEIRTLIRNATDLLLSCQYDVDTVDEDMNRIERAISSLIGLIDANYSAVDTSISETVRTRIESLLLGRLRELYSRRRNKIITKGEVDASGFTGTSVDMSFHTPANKVVTRVEGAVSGPKTPRPQPMVQQVGISPSLLGDVAMAAMDLVVEEVESDAGASNVTPAEDSIRQKDCVASGSITDGELADPSPSSATNDEASDLPAPSPSDAPVVVGQEGESTVDSSTDTEVSGESARVFVETNGVSPDLLPFLTAFNELMRFHYEEMEAIAAKEGADEFLHVIKALAEFARLSVQFVSNMAHHVSNDSLKAELMVLSEKIKVDLDDQSSECLAEIGHEFYSVRGATMGVSERIRIVEASSGQEVTSDAKKPLDLTDEGVAVFSDDEVAFFAEMALGSDGDESSVRQGPFVKPDSFDQTVEGWFKDIIGAEEAAE